MQRHPSIEGSIFSSWRLHAKIISETSLQVSFFLDLWHAHHNLDIIKNHQLNIVELIPDIYLATLASYLGVVDTFSLVVLG